MNRYRRVTRAFKQAPWRFQTQIASTGAAVLTVSLVLAGLFLAETSRTATTGRQVQELEARMDQLKRENAELRAQLANQRSVYRMYDRSRELGYLPAPPDRVEYLVVDGYPGQHSAPVIQDAPPVPAFEKAPVPVPDFTETLGEWLVQALYGINVEAAGEASE